MADLGRRLGASHSSDRHIPNYLQGNPIWPTEFSFPLLNVLVIAPVFEEFLMRGAILGTFVCSLGMPRTVLNL